MKKFLAATITLFVFSAFAGPKMPKAPEKKAPPFYRANVAFKYKDAQGKEIKSYLDVEQDIVRVNSEEVQKKNWKKGEAAMKAVMKLEKSSDTKCASGAYTLRVTKNEQHSQVETGCVGSIRFKDLEKNFAVLKGLLPKQYTKDMKPM